MTFFDLIVLIIFLAFVLLFSYMMFGHSVDADNTTGKPLPPAYRADELPMATYRVDFEAYIKEHCEKCSHYDGYDVCLHRSHWGTVIQNTVDWCYAKKSFDRKSN